MMESLLNPGSTDCSSRKLAKNNPLPATSKNASATSVATSTLRNRCLAAPAVEFLLYSASFRDLCVRASCTTGATPARNAASNPKPAATATTRRSICTAKPRARSCGITSSSNLPKQRTRQHTNQRSHPREQRRLHHKLHRQLPQRSPQRTPYRQLLHPRRSPRQHQP